MDEKKIAPAARSQGLVVEHLADETLIYDLERDEAHHLNPTAAAVFELSDGSATVGQLAAGAAKRVGQPVSVEAVCETVEGLAALNLLTGGSPHDEPGVSRREVVRKAALVGAGAAAAAPVIKSIVAPTPAMAQTNGVCRFCEEIEDCEPGEDCVGFNGGRCCLPFTP